jgi:hypothetical protein
MIPAALGLRTHSGWAALVAVTGPPQDSEILERKRIELIADGFPAQPYHAAERLPFAEAEALIHRSLEQAKRLALEALQPMIAQHKYEVTACGILFASGRPLPNLASTLASHALIHTAEGEHYRAALIHAAEHCGLRVTRVKEKDALANTVPGLQKDLARLGREIGPPWRQDEKLATVAAWLALDYGAAFNR